MDSKENKTPKKKMDEAVRDKENRAFESMHKDPTCAWHMDIKPGKGPLSDILHYPRHESYSEDMFMRALSVTDAIVHCLNEKKIDPEKCYIYAKSNKDFCKILATGTVVASVFGIDASRSVYGKGHYPYGGILGIPIVYNSTVETGVLVLAFEESLITKINFY